MENNDIEKTKKSQSVNATNNSTVIIAGAIIIAGALVAAAVLFGGGNSAKQTADSGSDDNAQAQTDQAAQRQAQQAAQKEALDKMTPVTEEDHIRGSLDAPVKIVEYADFECPFCNRFHDTMKQVVDEYPGDQVAWVYRHFPIDQLHPKNARKVAVISECVNELAGEDAFWQFTDGYYANSPANDQTNLEVVLPKLYDQIGVSEAAVNECVESGRFDEHVQSEVENAQASGGRGTPWSIVVGPDGERYPLSGAQPYRAVKQLIDSQLPN